MSKYTVNEFMELTGQKRGTVENYRSELQKYGLINNNARFDERALEVFKLIIKLKDSTNLTWVDAMSQIIQEEFGEEMIRPFEWTIDIHFKYLTNLVDEKLVRVEHIGGKDNFDTYVVFHIIIDNFKELGKKYEVFSNSKGTDGNAGNFKCTGKDFFYYVIGKLNPITRNEEAHIFYNEGLEFNLMKCKYIGGGSSDKGRLKELYSSLYKAEKED